MNQNEVLSDFQRRYSGTYLMVQEPDSEEKILCRCDAIEADDKKVATLKLFSNEMGTIRLNMATKHTLTFVSAPVGIFQHGADSCLCLRNPRKQYRRGICADNTHIYPVGATLTQTRGTPMSLEILQSAFAGRTYPYREALAMLKSNRYRSVAMHNYMTLMHSMTTTPGFVLFHWDCPIAKLDLEGKVVHIYEKALEPQVNQFLQKEGPYA